MRSGVIAQKVGMTRIFTEAGEHVPVTVLKLENAAGSRSSHRREERLHRAPARRRHAQAIAADEGGARNFRRGQGRAEAQARRVPGQPRKPDRGGRRDHRRPLRPGPVRRRDGHQPGQGFPGRHEALELRRSARHARRLGHAPQPRLDRSAPGPRQGVQGQEDGRPHGRRARHHAEPRRRQDRRGARPRDGARRGSRLEGRLGAGARRRQEGAHKDAPKPGAFKAAAAKPQKEGAA